MHDCFSDRQLPYPTFFAEIILLSDSGARNVVNLNSGRDMWEKGSLTCMGTNSMPWSEAAEAMLSEA